MPSPNPEKKMVIAFDAYGTLLSTESIATADLKKRRTGGVFFF